MNEEMMTKQEQIAALRKYATLSERSREYWGEEEHHKLEEMFYEGVDLSEMALHFQRTELAIMNQLMAMNLYKRVRQPSPKTPKCKCSLCDLRANCGKKSMSLSSANAPALCQSANSKLKMT